MAVKKISQAEARRLKKTIDELNYKLEHKSDALQYGWGTWLDAYTFSDVQFAKIKTAKRLGYALLLRPSETGASADLMAVKW